MAELFDCPLEASAASFPGASARTAGVATGRVLLIDDTVAVVVEAQISAPASLPAATVTKLVRLQGNFRLQSTSDRGALRRAIVAATGAAAPAQATRLRAQVQAFLTAAPRIELARDGASGLAFDEGRAALRAPVTGELKSISQEGGNQTPLTVSQKFDGSVLVQVVDGNGLRQERRVSLNASGTALTLDIRVSGTTLSVPVTSRSVYQRE